MEIDVPKFATVLHGMGGALSGVADEGGWWPAFDSNEEALEALVGAIERAGFV